MSHSPALWRNICHFGGCFFFSVTERIKYHDVCGDKIQLTVHAKGAISVVILNHFSITIQNAACRRKKNTRLAQQFYFLFFVRIVHCNVFIRPTHLIRQGSGLTQTLPLMIKTNHFSTLTSNLALFISTSWWMFDSVEGRNLQMETGVKCVLEFRILALPYHS